MTVQDLVEKWWAEAEDLINTNALHWMTVYNCLVGSANLLNSLPTDSTLESIVSDWREDATYLEDSGMHLINKGLSVSTVENIRSGQLIFVTTQRRCADELENLISR